MTTETSRSAARLGARGRLILITLCGATFMTGLDYSIITVALPEIGRDLGFSGASALQWVATACLLPTAALMPLFGRASDMVGRRRLFMTGVAGFTLMSLAAALAPSPATLVAARAGQGVAAAMIGPTALALMTSAFPEGPRRTRALGVNGALLSLGFVVGTIGGGLITSGLNWRWTMLLLAGIGSLVLLGALTVVRETAGRSRTGLDVPGAILASGGLFALVYGTIDRLAHGFFVNGAPATPSNCLYFSFTTLTTVGYGDLTAKSNLGHTLSVSEALLGQIYLVTVVSVLVSNLRRPERPRTS